MSGAPSTSTSTSVPVATTLPPLPEPAPVAWQSCGSGTQCGTLQVPLDYARPGGRHIGIALKRRLAGSSGQRIGSLVMNPGGPGDSGIDAMANHLSVLTAGVLARFDIVEFDPRGVGRSEPVHCEATAQRGTPPAQPDPVPQTPAARDALVQSSREYADGCSRFSGDVLPFVGTDNVARDLDMIRAVVGDDRLTFMGQSYGTYLGLVYADLFPTRVRSLVLDGVIDPSLTTEQLGAAQADGFERALSSFGSWCASTASCGWHPGASADDGFSRIVAAARDRPLPGSGGRTLGPGEAYLGALDALYAKSSWPSLGRALAAASSGNGGPLLAMSDHYLQHGSANAYDANSAVNCIDHPTVRDLGAYPSLAAQAANSSPVFGPFFAWGGIGCAVWPASGGRAARPVRASGSPPILVIGTTDDPGTPYAWAKSAAQQLERGVLLTRQGQDHVAYFYSSCVRSAVERYLIDGVTPAVGTVCP